MNEVFSWVGNAIVDGIVAGASCAWLIGAFLLGWSVLSLVENYVKRND
jgi:thiosulfate reductase cytochrome b subunit